MSRMRRDAQGDGGLVYSTDQGRMCPGCRLSAAQCVCAHVNAPAASDSVARVRLDSKGRKGKAVTLVQGLPLAAEALTALSRELKALCGVGGTVKDGAVELQGDHVERVLVALTSRGLRAKRG